MADNVKGGEEKLIAVAKHIAKTLGHSNSSTDDILHIFSTFDHRLNLSPTTTTTTTSTTPTTTMPTSTATTLTTHHPLSSTFLHSLDHLISTVHHLSPSHPHHDLLHQSLFRLQDQFRSLILNSPNSPNSPDSSDSNSPTNSPIPIAHPITDFNIIIDALPSSTINDLQEITKRMIAADYSRECSHVYSACRREFLEESFSRLGLQKLSSEEVQKLPWVELEDEIERWCKAMMLSLRVLFPSERRLCDRVFFGFPTTADFSFMEVCRGSVIQLLNFADAIAISSRSPERFFKVLDVYETLRDLMPEFEVLFCDQYCVLLRNEAFAIWRRVGEAIRGIFMELENLIRRDPAKSGVPGGALHPITRYVMNYLRAACKSQQTLEEVFEEERERGLANTGSLSVQMVWIMELLESNLEAKSKIYNDSALSAVFMMNNGRYIVEKVKDSELGMLLGEDWIRKHNAKVRQFVVSYQRSCWNNVVGLLMVDRGDTGLPNTRQVNLKERLRMFNSHFEEIVRVQSTWVIFDEQQKEDLKIAIVRYVLPAYRDFIGRIHSSLETRRNSEKLIKYSMEDLETQINDKLFRGNGGRR